MIDFRYHVVSIVAVFLALAIGIILGSTELRGTAYNILDHASQVVTNDLHTAKAQRDALQQQVNGDEAFALADESRLLGGLLTGQRVVLVTAPGAPGQVTNGIVSALQKAGAVVTGQVDLLPKLLDASQNTQQELSSLALTLAPPGAAPSNGTGLQQAAQLLGSVILTKNASSGTPSGKQSANGQAILSSYAQAGLLSISSGQPANPATLAVVIAPDSPPAAASSNSVNQGLITLAQELNIAGLGTVVASSISGSISGSVIDALRGSSAAAQISTVDDADTIVGQIVVVQALALALTSHKVGAYGIGPGSTAAAPSPAPAPSATTPAGQVAASQPAKSSARTR